MSVDDELFARRMAAIQACVEAVAQRREPGGLLADETSQTALELLRLVDDGRLDSAKSAAAVQALAWLYWFRSQAANTRTDIRTALQLFQRLAATRPELVPQQVLTFLVPPATDLEDAQRVGAVEELAVVSRTDPGSWLLDLAVEVIRIALATTSPVHRDLDRLLDAFMTVLRARFSRDGQVDDLNDALEATRSALAVTDDIHPRRAMHLANLSGLTRLRYGCLGQAADLDEAISSGRASLALIPASEPNRASVMANLCAAHFARFGESYAAEDLDTAIQFGRDALQTAADGTDPAPILSNLAMALRGRYLRFGAPADLDEAIVHLRAVRPPGAGDVHNRAAHSLHFGGALLSRYRRNGARKDLDEATDSLRSALAVIPLNHIDRAKVLVQLGSALEIGLDQGVDAAGLDEAVGVYEEAIAAPGVDRARVLAGLGSVLRIRYERTGLLDVGTAAVQALREAVSLVDPKDVDFPNYASSLGNGLRRLFEGTGARAHLDGCITFTRAAVQAAPQDHHLRSTFLSNLGLALQARADWTGELADSEEAIMVGCEAVEATAANDQNRALRQSNLGNSLLYQFGLSGLPVHADEAVGMLQAAVDATPVGHPDRALRLSNLGGGLLARHDRFGELGDLTDAVALHRDAVDAAAAADPERIGYLSNLSVALRRLSARTDERAPLDESIDIARTVLAAVPAGHARHGQFLVNLADALHLRYGRHGEPNDLREAVAAWNAAMRMSSAAMSTRIQAAAVLGRTHADLGHWPSAADAYAAAVELLPVAAGRALSRPSNEQVLRQRNGLATHAAACMIAAGQAQAAVETLERARGVLWGGQLDTRNPTTALRQVAPDLARRLDELRVQLLRPESVRVDLEPIRAPGTPG